MDKFANIIINHRKLIIIFFLILVVVCVGLQFFVKVNYDMTDYLPPDAQSTKALQLMNQDFTEPMPNTKVMIKNISIMEAVDYKNKIAEIEGISQVIWLDDMVDIKQPLAMYDTETVEGFYKEGNALFQIAMDKGSEKETTAALQKLVGEENAVAGEAPDLSSIQTATGNEAGGAMLLLIPIIILILTLSTNSWVEPAFFLINIGVAILINMGTNIFLGNISFMSFSVSPILQMACSLDYGIFLMHSFGANRQKYTDVKEAMKHSIKESMSTVAASAVTTLFGFLALVFMNFRIGADLGINLAKGIVISFITVIIFLPALTLCAYKFIDKTHHRKLMPEFKNIHKYLSRIAIPIVIILFIIVIPAYLGQIKTEFIYGNEDVDVTNKTTIDSKKIKDVFGSSTVMAVLVPRGDVVRELELGKELENIPHVSGVMSYASTVGTAIPPEYLGDEITSQFYGKNYARIVVYTNTKSEGEVAFDTVEKIQNKIKEYYGYDAYSLGQSTNLYDMKKFVEKDNIYVNLIAIISIFFVLLINFRSLVIPLLLLLTIESAIWINLSIPYFIGTPINFIGYLVLSTVQLGATVDYAILLTTNYMRQRQLHNKKQAIHNALGDSFKSILVSGATLASAGFILASTTSNPSIGDIGVLLGRGTVLSVLMVTCFLPAMLTILDKPLGKTTYKSNFLKEEKPKIVKNKSEKDEAKGVKPDEI